MADLRMEPLAPDEVWPETPPEPGSKYQARLDWMRDHPFEWLLWDPATQATSLPKGMAARGFLSKSVTNPTEVLDAKGRRLSRLYARYVGPANVQRVKKNPQWSPTPDELQDIREAAMTGLPTPFLHLPGTGSDRRLPQTVITSTVTSRGPTGRRTFSSQYKDEVVMRIRKGKSAPELARELGIAESVIRTWARDRGVTANATKRGPKAGGA